jgi:chemotaxis signal transduction protein
VLLISRIANRRIAVPAAFVEQILPMVEVTPLLGALPRLLGLMNLHGTILPVVNLRPLLDLFEDWDDMIKNRVSVVKITLKICP